MHSVDISRGDFLRVNEKKIKFDITDKVKVSRVTRQRANKRVIAPKTRVRSRVRNGWSFRNIKEYCAKYSMKFSKKYGKTSIVKMMSAHDVFPMAKKMVSYGIGVAVMVVLVFGSLSMIDVKLGSEVIVNGQSVGLISDKSEFQKILQEAEELAKVANDGEPLPPLQAVYIPRIVTGDSITSEFELKQGVLANYDKLIEGYAVYVGDQIVCATIDEKEAFSALDDMKSKYFNPETDQNVDFVDFVVVRKEFVPLTQIVSGKGLVVALTGASENREIYTVEDGDTIWGVSRKFGMDMEKLVEMNSDILDDMTPGRKLNVMHKRPVIAIKTTRIEDYNEEIPYTTNTEDDNSMNRGAVKVVAKGEEGSRRVVAEVVCINGEESARNIQQEEILKEAKDETVKIGTRDVVWSGEIVAIGGPVGSGQFGMPVYGSVSSRFGSRWGEQHTGIDWSCPVGTNVYAADDGTVTFAGWNGGYGNMIKIDHGNGYVTYYAHCSSLLVSPGTTVSTGDVIALSGNTGRSTGPHLHFEVRVNGVPMNPEAYLN